MLPGLIPPGPDYDLHNGPYGPHTLADFKVWVPKEYYVEFMTFAMLNRGDLMCLIHPLGRASLEDHTTWAMYIGGVNVQVDESHLSVEGGDEPEFPELGLGYNAPMDF